MEAQTRLEDVEVGLGVELVVEGHLVHDLVLLLDQVQPCGAAESIAKRRGVN